MYFARSMFTDARVKGHRLVSGYLFNLTIARRFQLYADAGDC